MKNDNDWIDFNLVKQSVSMELLIIHFGLLVVKRNGDEVRLKCPFHNGKSDNSMVINLTRNSFYCFGCKARGGVLDFVAKFEDCSLHEAALMMDQWFLIGRQSAESKVSRELVSSQNCDNITRITPAHLIASIEHQLTQLKKLILSR